jgi:hypothetical protein
MSKFKKTVGNMMKGRNKLLGPISGDMNKTMNVPESMRYNSN